uniref:Protein kinase domain-containing protein n=1 Tax=Macrostomum lignano TaxID=282301 RepID=A0A1I8FRK9_9PLAT
RSGERRDGCPAATGSAVAGGAEELAGKAERGRKYSDSAKVAVAYPIERRSKAEYGESEQKRQRDAEADPALRPSRTCWPSPRSARQQALFRCVAQNDLGRVGELLRQSHVDNDAADARGLGQLADMIRLLLKAGASWTTRQRVREPRRCTSRPGRTPRAAVAPSLTLRGKCSTLSSADPADAVRRAGHRQSASSSCGPGRTRTCSGTRYIPPCTWPASGPPGLRSACWWSSEPAGHCGQPAGGLPHSFTLAARLGHVEMLRLLATRGATVAASGSASHRAAGGRAVQQDEAASFLSKLQKDRPPELPSASRWQHPASTISDSDTDTDESDTSEYDDTDSSSDLDTAATVSADGTLAPSRAAPAEEAVVATGDWRSDSPGKLRRRKAGVGVQHSRSTPSCPDDPSWPLLTPQLPLLTPSCPSPAHASKPATAVQLQTVDPKLAQNNVDASNPGPSLLPKRQTKYRTIRSSRICRNNGASEDDSPPELAKKFRAPSPPAAGRAVAEALRRPGQAAANQFVAVKVVKLSANAQPSAASALLEDDRDHQGNFCIFTELLSGNSLAGILEEYGVFSEDGIANFARQICSALDYIHTRSPPVLHWDLKCSNVMLTNEGVIKLIDFGLAKEIAASMAANATEVVGTPCFISPPEILDGGQLHGQVGHLVAGLQPSSRWPPGRRTNATREHQAVMFAICNKPMPRLAAKMSKSLHAFYGACVQKVPTARPSAAGPAGPPDGGGAAPPTQQFELPSCPCHP